MSIEIKTYSQVVGIPAIEIDEIEPQKASYVNNDLLKYKIPVLSPDGTCSADKGFEAEPYDLRKILNVKNIEHEKTIVQKIESLYELLESIQLQLKSDWIGIYQVAQNIENKKVLVKLAYLGLPSRAEFPLTEEFAQLSNNSTVGLSGKAIIINKISEHEGAYYVCDASVNSEACLPIYDKELRNVIGIVDAESFKEGHFNDKNVALVAKLCQQLSGYLPI